ncbi:diphthine--ammonia ligase [Candidatus Micrarchaeota archaeon]|nr:diphthine--ammonia ligase [Candidatus Micrarchaeota archaeon]
MRTAVLFSGGKDSVFAAHWAVQQGFEVVLVTVRPPDYSMMFHHPNIDATKMQAEAMGLKQVFVEVDESDWKEKLMGALKPLKAEAIVSGAVASTYQRSRLDGMAKELGIQSFAPLWHKGPELMEQMLRDFEIYVIAVSAEGLGPEFLGEPLRKLIQAKKPGVHLFLEGGEGETFVTDAPLFRKRIVIKKWKKTWDGVRGVAEIEDASFAPK